MATPKRLLKDPNEADYETLTYAAAALEKQGGRVVFSPAPDEVKTKTLVMILRGEMVSAKDLGELLWYIADVLEDAHNRVD